MQAVPIPKPVARYFDIEASRWPNRKITFVDIELFNDREDKPLNA